MGRRKAARVAPGLDGMAALGVAPCPGPPYPTQGDVARTGCASGSTIKHPLRRSAPAGCAVPARARRFDGMRELEHHTRNALMVTASISLDRTHPEIIYDPTAHPQTCSFFHTIS